MIWIEFIITVTSQLAGWNLKSPASRVFTQTLVQAQIKEKSKLGVTGLCEANSPGAGEFPAQRASNAENVPISWRHHDPKISAWDYTHSSRGPTDKGYYRDFDRKTTVMERYKCQIVWQEIAMTWLLLGRCRGQVMGHGESWLSVYLHEFWCFFTCVFCNVLQYMYVLYCLFRELVCEGYDRRSQKFTRPPGGWFNITMLSCQYRKSHCGEKTILRPS